jgi:hypothetical protein
VLVVSEELDELFEICDRLHVVAKGRLSPSVDRAAATVQQIGEWMSGLWDAAARAGRCPCLSWNNVPRRRSSGPMARRCWRC